MYVCIADFRLYKKLLQEDHKKKQKRHAYFKDAYSGTFFERLINCHNSTMDPDNLIRIIIQYTSCVSIIAAFLIMITMVGAIKPSALFIYILFLIITSHMVNAQLHYSTSVVKAQKRSQLCHNHRNILANRIRKL